MSATILADAHKTIAALEDIPPTFEHHIKRSGNLAYCGPKHVGMASNNHIPGAPRLLLQLYRSTLPF